MHKEALNVGGYTLYFAECFYLPSVFGCLPSVFLAGTQRIRHFAECLFFCRVFSCLHTAKYLFAEWMMECTRQTTRHSANVGFPVVLDETHSCVKQRWEGENALQYNGCLWYALLARFATHIWLLMMMRSSLRHQFIKCLTTIRKKKK